MKQMVVGTGYTSRRHKTSTKLNDDAKQQADSSDTSCSQETGAKVETSLCIPYDARLGRQQGVSYLLVSYELTALTKNLSSQFAHRSALQSFPIGVSMPW